MTIGRRGVFHLGALGLGALALEGCGAGPMPTRGAPLDPAAVDRLLDHLDRVVAHLEVYDAAPVAAEADRGRQRCIGLLTALCFLGAYRDLPASAWREPRVAAHLERSLPRIQAAVSRARAHLAGLDDELIVAIDARLARDPELPMEIMERIDGYGKEIDVPLEQRAYLRVSTAQLAARFRYEGVRAVTGKLAATHERLLDARVAELDGPREDHPGPALRPTRAAGAPRPELLGSAVATGPRGVEGESCETDLDCDAGLACDDHGECASEGPSARPLRDTAGKVAVVGAWLLIPPLCPIGVLVLLQSLFIMILSGIVGRSR